MELPSITAKAGKIARGEAAGFGRELVLIATF